MKPDDRLRAATAALGVALSPKLNGGIIMDKLAYSKIPVGVGYTTVLPDMDFETYSEAGFEYNEVTGKWVSVMGSGKKGGLPAVGSAVYAQHPSTEILSLAYDLKDGRGCRLWIPGMPPPQELFNHLNAGGLIEAHNCSFEFLIWKYVCTERMGWPMIDYRNMRDSMAKCRAFTLPGALDKAGAVLKLTQTKDKEGTRLLKKFSVPRQPTGKDRRLRIKPEDDILDAMKLYAYNLQDIVAESALSESIPDLPPEELEFWVNSQACNFRGVGINPAEVEAGIKILEQAYSRYNAELYALTGTKVAEATKVDQLMQWCASRGVRMPSLDDEAVTNTLDMDIPSDVRRALEIRQLIGSAGVKKVYAMQRQATRENRLCNLFIYHGARTGRDTGADVQPQNLVKAGPKIKWCSEGCKRPSGANNDWCPHCGGCLVGEPTKGWSWEAVDTALGVMQRGSLDEVERIFGNAILTLSGCIRGLFVAAPGKDLICSDYSSIEAVVTAVLSGEQWRIEAFNRKEDIYLVSAGRITGRTMDEYLAHHEETGDKHPDRQKIGKPAELGLGFGGWLTAWRQFDKSDNFSDNEVKDNIKAWRDASPAIVEMWGGQMRGKPWAPDSFELFGLEGTAIQAVQNPGVMYTHRYISFGVKDDVLYCRLPSGRFLTYHKPRLATVIKWEHKQLQLSYEGWNSNPKMGSLGWQRIETYGGRLMENVVQAVARDIMAYANNRLEDKGYPVVLRVHDEIVCEVPENFGNIEDFEAIMMDLPEWAKGWPIRAAGGWRGKRYRKD
jgi:DNA polymerase